MVKNMGLCKICYEYQIILQTKYQSVVETADNTDSNARHFFSRHSF